VEPNFRLKLREWERGGGGRRVQNILHWNSSGNSAGGGLESPWLPAKEKSRGALARWLHWRRDIGGLKKSRKGPFEVRGDEEKGLEKSLLLQIMKEVT